MKFITQDRFRELAGWGDSSGTGVSRLARVVRATDDGTRTVRFVLSDSSVDRMGDSISASGWELESYRKNPVVLWAHDANQPPIGRMKGVFISGDKLIGDVQFAPPETYEFADQVYRLITAGYIKSGSVGFIPIDYKFSDTRPGGIDFKRQELLEFSIVPVPANANALIEARGYGGQRNGATAPSAAPERLPIHYTGTLAQRQAQRDRENVGRRRRVARALRLRVF